MTTAENIDCMVGMSRYPDKWFDLAIADPPYKIGASKKGSYHTKALTNYKPKKWDDVAPTAEYWEELFRVSKNQIVWGGNYFPLPISAKWIVWDKMQPEGIDQAMFELAWSSFAKKQSMIFRLSVSAEKNCVSNNKSLARINRRIHPTQKPVALYRWIFQNYAKPGQRIIDPMMGSGSSRIAAHDMGFEYVGFELDFDYFTAQEARFAAHIAKPQLFSPEQTYTFKQESLFAQ